MWKLRQRGYDVTEYALGCFGSAGGQHACMIADTLGMETVLIHPLSGLLSAYGMGLAKLRVSQSFKLGDVLHKHMLIMAVVRPMIQQKFRDHAGDGLGLYNKAMDVLERTHFQSVSLMCQVWSDYIKSRADEHNEYVDEDNKQLGVDMSKFILFRG